MHQVDGIGILMSGGELVPTMHYDTRL